MKVLIAMTLAAIGAAVGWNLRTTMLHERELATKDAQLKIMQHELEISRERDKELITMMAEELKKLQEHIAEMKSVEQPTPLAPQPFEIPKKDPKNKKDPRIEDYQHILRDKFEQRTEQMQMKK